MEVQLIEYTGRGLGKRAAAELLAFTKNTRLEMSPSGLDDIKNMSDDALTAELRYMADTIPSSWEFVEYTFLLTKCTRAFTHQLVRNRHGSYAQQTMRVLNVEGFTYDVGPTIENEPAIMEQYCDTMATINSAYQEMIEDGAAIEDARGVLPTNIHTNIVAKFNLRTVAEICSKRASPRTQGEYREFLEGMREQVLLAHPWAAIFLANRKHRAATELIGFFTGESNVSESELIRMTKLVDMLRG